MTKKVKTTKAAKAQVPEKVLKKKSGTSSTDGSNRQLILSFPGTRTPVSLRFDTDLEYDEWAPVGIGLRKVKEWLQFAIGAWLNHGEQHWGEMYTQAAAETGLPEETLMIFKYVDSRVPEEVRILEDHMNWSHHRMVAKFPPEEQSKWLKMAHQKGWSIRDLKDALKKE